VALEATRDAGVSFFYAVPCRALGTCDAAPDQKMTARLADGNPLPDWLKFDANTATFFGQAPAQTRTLVVRVSPAARDAKLNNDAATVVTLKFLGSGALAKR
jgi:fibronectin-binding autotransporter adhesin